MRTAGAFGRAAEGFVRTPGCPGCTHGPSGGAYGGSGGTAERSVRTRGPTVRAFEASGGTHEALERAHEASERTYGSSVGTHGPSVGTYDASGCTFGTSGCEPAGDPDAAGWAGQVPENRRLCVLSGGGSRLLRRLGPTEAAKEAGLHGATGLRRCAGAFSLWCGPTGSAAWRACTSSAGRILGVETGGVLAARSLGPSGVSRAYC